MKRLLSLLCLLPTLCFGQAFSYRDIPWMAKFAATPSGGGGGGGLTIVQTNTIAVLHSASVTPWTTNLMSVTSGNTLVGLFADEDDSTGVATAVITDSQGNTWTKRCDASAPTSGNIELWTAKATSTGTCNVTNTWSQATGPQNKGRSAVVFEISGVETTLGGAAATTTAQTTPSLAITTTRANSLIIGGVCDFAPVAPPVTYRAGAVQAFQDNQTPGTYRADYYYIQATTATAYTTGESAPAAQKAGVVAYEIRTP